MARWSRMGLRAARGVASAGMGLSLLLAGPPSRAGEVVEYYHLDAIGNVRAVTNAAGQVVERHDYLPFGEEWCPGPPAQVCGSVTPGQPKRFTGKERDAETGLDYFGARYYGSKIGRFTTVDPVYTWQENLVDPQRWNRYAYARNNPLRYVDPDGKAVLAANAMPSAQTFQRNAEIRAAVMSVMRFDPFLQDQALVGMALGMAFPASPGEFKANQLSFMLGMAAPLEVGGKEVLAGAAKNVAHLQRLNAQLASEAQLAELQAGKGVPMAGAGAKAPIKDIERLVGTYGGDAADWAKVKSSHYEGGGRSFETHGYGNVKTGGVVEPKVKLSQ
jgi:RHS repeat-associated protein